MATYTKAGFAKTGPSAAAPAYTTTASSGISVAFSDGPLEAAPTWTRIDTTLVADYSIRRGRTDELDRTDTGTATVNGNDRTGVVDPTNISDYDGKQVAIALHNPVTDVWRTIFRGLIDDVQCTVDLSQVVTRFALQCVDGLDYLAGFELRLGADPDFPIDGDPVPASSVGNIYYQRTALIDGGSTGGRRVNDVLDDASWPAALREVFTFNVYLPGTVYSPGTSALTVIDEACDAEFPGIANRYVAKDGTFAAHGRLARFNPTDGQYHIHTWKVGDGDAVEADSSYAHLRGFTYSRPRSRVVNSAYFTPQGILDADIGDQLFEDPTSQGLYGLHSLSGENLRIESSALTGNNANDECKLYADYWVTVRSTPQTRVDQVTFRSMHPADPRAATVWNLMCNIDISDRIQLKCGLPGGGSFNDELYFVDGLAYDVRPGPPEYADVTLTLYLTPATDYDFPWT